MSGLLPGPAASNKPSRRASAKPVASPNMLSAEGEDANPFPVADSPKTPSAAFDPLATPPHKNAGKSAPVPAPAPVPMQAAPAAAAGGGNVIDDFDWLLSGAKKPAAAASTSSSAAAASAAATTGANGGGADPLEVPDGVDPFDVFWTGGGAPRPLPDSDPWPEPRAAAAAPADDDDDEPQPRATAAPVVKKKPAAGAAGAGADRKAPAPAKTKATPKAAPAAEDDADTKAALAADDEDTADAKAPPAARRINGPFACKVDVLKFMRKGCPLLKFGSYGYPHFRQFQLSTDNKKLVWFSAGKAITDSQIDLRDVDEIVLGQHTDKFGKHKEVVQLEKSSFSVYYAYRKKTLDVIAKDPNEFTVWTRGLQELVRRAQKNENLAQLSELVLELTLLPNRRTNPDIIDAASGKPVVDLIAAASAPAAAGAGGEHDTHDKGRYKVIGENLAYMKKRILKYSEKLKQSQYYMSPQHNTMKELLKKLQESAVKVSDSFHAGQFALCDDELWRANVDLESLKNMMKAIDASID